MHASAAKYQLIPSGTVFHNLLLRNGVGIMIAHRGYSCMDMFDYNRIILAEPDANIARGRFNASQRDARRSRGVEFI
jgi:hypothetical protein